MLHLTKDVKHWLTDEKFTGINFTREQVTEALVSMGKSESVRGEAFTLEEFAKLTDILNSK